MSLIIIPHSVRGPSEEYGGRDFAPGYQPRAPICMKCSREATFENPVGCTLRKSWNPMDKNPRAGIDAICAECRQRMAGR